ncbi:MAG: LacI family DNA-binding transcriptional regulator [Eubacterium sp.]|nr:LacI family DNA-binding transcriptional regulator [Eubacterium sp.]
MKKKSVTMSDIAKTLEVSTVTVSKALGDKDGVSEELRTVIKQKASEMGYRFSCSSKSAKDGFSFNISIVVAKHFIKDASAFYWVMYRYIIELLQKYNYYGILDVVSESDEANLVMPGSVTDKKTDGIIVLGQLPNKYVNEIEKLDIPVVFLDFYSGENRTDTILSDSFFGSYMITNYLINAGHKSIGFVGSITSTSSIQDRYLGFYKALLEKGLPLNEKWVIGDRSADGVMFKKFELPDELPTAFVCNCDETAYALVNQLKNSGYLIPDDISVVGYDNHIYSTISTPRITTVDVDSRQMSSEAVETIIKKIRDRGYSRGRTLVNGKLIIRDSVKKIK